MNLTEEEYEILDHTMNRAANRFYCGDSPAIQSLIAKGLMRSVGWKPCVGDEYFTICQAVSRLYLQYMKETQMGRFTDHVALY